MLVDAWSCVVAHLAPRDQYHLTKLLQMYPILALTHMSSGVAYEMIYHDAALTFEQRLALEMLSAVSQDAEDT